MILRRFMQHVREQNWFAVGLDVIVVIVGIFLGLQVQEWNEARKQEQLSNQTLLELRDEFNAISQSATSIANLYVQIIDNLEILIESVEQKSIDEGDREAILHALANGEAVLDPPIHSGTFRSLVSSGNLDLVQNKQLEIRLLEYEVSIESIVTSDSNIVAMLMPFTKQFKKHATFDGTFEIPEEENFNFVEIKLPSVIDFDETALLEDTEFLNAARQHLRFQAIRLINIRVAQNKIFQIQDLINAEVVGVNVNPITNQD